MTFLGKNGFCAKVKSLSQAGVQTLKGRKLGFETLEERQLLTATAGLVALDSLAEEGSTSSTGTLRIELTTAATEPTTISFYGDGDAIPGDDYTLLNKTTSAPLTPVYDANANAYLFTITIPTAASYLDLELLATSDALQEPTERANFTLVAGASYEVLTNESSATVEIVDRNSWLVGLATSSSIAEEAGVDGVFVVSRAGSLALSSPLTVKIELDGDATPNSDYIVRSVSGREMVIAIEEVDGKRMIGSFRGHYDVYEIDYLSRTVKVQFTVENTVSKESAGVFNFDWISIPELQQHFIWSETISF